MATIGETPPMPNDHAELVSLLSVMSAAERGLSPLGPEFAGFVVLEAAQRLREAGGGIATARELAIDVAGHVHLVAQPGRGDDAQSTAGLRALLGALLESATSSTPALRACARRKEQTSSAMLARELQAALIPLNRAASRRGVARVAKSTVDALAKGSIAPPSLADDDARDPSPPAMAPVGQVAPVARPIGRSAPLPATTRLPTVIVSDETTPCDTSGPWVDSVGATPVTLADIERTVDESHVAAPMAEEDASDDDIPIEIVSNLPPLAETAATTASGPRVDDDQSPHAAFAVPLASEARVVDGLSPRADGRTDRVEALLAGFRVSRLRSDPALSRDLKAMIGIDTSGPPRVAPRVLRESASSMAVDVRQQVNANDETPIPLEDELLVTRRPRGRGLTLLAFVVLGAAVAVGATPRARNAVRALFSPPTPPPGDATTPTPVKATARPATSTAHVPTACEATLTLQGVDPGAEVVRKLGVAPVSTSVPTHVPLDLVGVAPGMAARRLHVDPSAAWSTDVTGAHLELPLMLDVGSATTWAPRTGPLSPAPIDSTAGRGTLRILGNPPGTTIWLVVAPNAMAVPCGNAVDLLVIVPPSDPRAVHVEWSSFTGAPPHAVAKL
jgi:hypothetical protein